MEEFWFYIQLGLDHVLDFSAYDHILFLSALAIPFTFKSWKKVLVLATVFTIAHCASLALSVYEVVVADASWIEFLIPVTIFLTALYNFLNAKEEKKESMFVQTLCTVFFGLIHGFGFSNYFKMLMAGEESKIGPLFGFATGIELSQITIIIGVLMLVFLAQTVLKMKQSLFIVVSSAIIIIITIPMLVKTFPL